MNVFTNFNRSVGRTLAIVVALAMVMSTFPVSFFVANAQAAPKVNICKANQSLGSFVEGVKSVSENAIQEGLANSGVNGDIVENGQNWDFVYPNGFTGAEIFAADCHATVSGSISGTKYDDVGNDGSIAGDTGIENWTIRLYKVDTPWVLVDTQITDGDGKYWFTELPAGEYKVCEVMQDNWTQTFVSNGSTNESPNVAEEGPKCRTVNIDTLVDDNTVNFGNYYEEPEVKVDYCDASQRPNGMSIAAWHEANDFDGSSCFDYEVTQQCGSLDVQFTRNDTSFGFAFNYALGSDTPAPANWEGDGTLPVYFEEDENGGSVDVTYYVVGDESDFFTGSGVPNIWDGNGTTVTVNTDCKADEPEPEQCVNLLKNGSFEEPVVTNKSLWQKFLVVPGWTIEKIADDSATTLEVHRDWSSNEAADGEQYVELDGDHSTRVLQTVDTLVDGYYELSWAFAPRHNIAANQNQLSVLVDDVEVSTEGPATGAAGLEADDWTRGSYSFTATEEETKISFEDAGPSNTFGTFLDDARLCLVREPEPEPELPDNDCLVPETANNEEDFEVNLSSLPTLQSIFDDNNYSFVDVEDDQIDTQLWHFESPDTDYTTFEVKVLAKYAGHNQAFGYYEAGNAGTFVPLFKVGAHSAAVPEVAIGSTIEVTVENNIAQNIGFAMDTENGGTTVWYSEYDLNPGQIDNLAVYNPADNTYLLAFEDLENGDYDYNDLVLEITKLECHEEADMCQLEIVSDTGTVVVESNEYAAETWDEHSAWTASIPGADWIWKTFLVENPTQQETYTFYESFTVGNPGSATLEVAADNSYRVTINGVLFHEENDGDNYQSHTQKTFDVLSVLQDGENTMEIEVTNAAQSGGNAKSNPAGLLYKLAVDAEYRCELTTEPGDVNPNDAPYCGNGTLDQEWEQCDGEEGCADYCLWENQCHDEQLVKITFDEQAPASESFDSTIHLGAVGNTVPSGTWFKFNEAGDATVQSIASSPDFDGLAVERTGTELRLAVMGGNSSQEFDYMFGDIEVLGLTMGTLDRATVAPWPLENSGYKDIWDEEDNNLEFQWYLTTGNDAAAVELLAGDEYGQCEPGNNETLYRIEGNVWHDDDRDEEWGEDEDGLAGREVKATDGEEEYSTTTDEYGYYYFDVPAGTWVITWEGENGWIQTTPEGGHVVTVPEEFAMSWGETIMNFLIPTAHAAVAIETYGDYDFGIDEEESGITTTSTGGGGGGNRIELTGGGSSSGGGNDNSPEGQVAGASDSKDPLPGVLGEQVSIMPLGAPNAGAGGTAPSATTTWMLLAAFLGVFFAAGATRYVRQG